MRFAEFCRRSDVAVRVFFSGGDLPGYPKVRVPADRNLIEANWLKTYGKSIDLSFAQQNWKSPRDDEDANDKPRNRFVTFVTGIIPMQWGK